MQLIKNLIKILPIFLLILSSAYADRLLVISSDIDSAGSEIELTQAFEKEKLGATLVEEALKEKYQKVYKLTFYSDDSVEFASEQVRKTLKTILKEKNEWERLDVFSMQHGPAKTPLLNLRIPDIRDFVPYGFIRNVYTTSCWEFGEIAIVNNNDFTIEDYNPDFATDLESIGVDTYIYHANMNATGYFTLPLMLKHIKRNDDWAMAAIKAYKEFDLQLTQLIPTILSLSRENVLNTFIPGINKITELTPHLIKSRIAIGQKKKLQSNSFKNQLNLNLESEKYSQRMVKLQPELEYVLKKHCPGGISDYDMDCSDNIAKRPLHKVSESVLDQLLNLFNNFGEQGCFSSKVVNQFLNEKDINLEVQKLCFKKTWTDTYKLSWVLNQDKLFSLNTKIVTGNMDAVRRITVRRFGSLKFRITRKNKLKIRLSGIKVFANGIDGNGKMKWLTVFKPRGLNIENSGTTEAKVKLHELPLSVGIDKVQEMNDIDMIDFFRFFGFKISVDKVLELIKR